MVKIGPHDLAWVRKFQAIFAWVSYVLQVWGNQFTKYQCFQWTIYPLKWIYTKPRYFTNWLTFKSLYITPHNRLPSLQQMMLIARPQSSSVKRISYACSLFAVMRWEEKMFFTYLNSLRGRYCKNAIYTWILNDALDRFWLSTLCYLMVNITVVPPLNDTKDIWIT